MVMLFLLWFSYQPLSCQGGQIRNAFLVMANCLWKLTQIRTALSPLVVTFFLLESRLLWFAFSHHILFVLLDFCTSVNVALWPHQGTLSASTLSEYVNRSWLQPAKVVFWGLAFLHIQPLILTLYGVTKRLPSHLLLLTWLCLEGAGILANQSFRQAIPQIVLGFLIKTVGFSITWQRARSSHLTIAFTIYQQ